MTPTERDNVQHLLDAAAKLIFEYHAEIRSVRYKTDDENVSALADALAPFYKDQAMTPPETLSAQDFKFGVMG